MADVLSSPLAPSTSPRKRPAPSDESPRRVPLNTKGTQFMMPTPPDTEESSNASPDGSINNDERKRAASPAPSVSTIASSIEVVSSNAVPSSSTTTATATQSTMPASTSTTGPPPAKRRKLTPAEKVEQARAKEAKARETAEKKALAEQKKADAAAEKARKAEEKARKDEEKAEERARKDEEKRAKDEEKRAKAEEKEAKKREKELEEERKVQEKLVKERKQMRLGAFFAGKPTTPAKGGNDGGEDQPRTRRKSLSLEPFDAVADQIPSFASPAKGTPPPTSAKKPAVSDYKRKFLPFELPATGRLAPVPDHSEADQARFDHELNDPSIQEKYDLGLVTSYASVNNYFEGERSVVRGFGFPNIEKVVDNLRGVSSQPIDLTGETSTESGVDVLSRVPIRLIQFDEDVRPGYQGSYTKITSPRTVRKMRRNPFTKARPDTNYDVDSEAEWEEPEEGDEEILDDDEDEADSQADAGEMDDFLDDEEEVKTKRKLITDSLAPENTGLCWENDGGRIRVVDGVDVSDQPKALSGMRLGFLLPGFSGMTIDPFSTAYWEKPVPVPVAPVVVETPPTNGLMAPPRQPLQPKLNFSGTQAEHLILIGAAEGQKGPITSLAASQAAKRGPKPAPRILNKEDLEEFKEAVIGSPLGKLELLKGLKNRFPRITNETIKENLSTLFAQKGTGKAKQWVFVGDS